jgi:hypothetical protein
MYIFSISTSILAPSEPHTDSHRVPLDSLTRTPKDQKYRTNAPGENKTLFLFLFFFPFFFKNNGTEERKDIGGEGERILGGGTG